MKIKLYKIESGKKIPPPTIKPGNGLASKGTATLNALKPGQSFLVRDLMEAMRVRKNMQDLNARERAKGSGRLFAARQVKGGVRFWCLD